MERRVPKSNKYSHISGVLNTGLTIDKVKAVTAREYAKRRDEIFFRITKTQLYELYNEYEADEYETISETGRGAHNVHIVTYSEDQKPVYEKPYLLLDMREIEEFQICHLLQARSFPYAMLRRDRLHPDIYQFRNVPERLVIVYCNDERISRLAAKDLVDRGVDNVFLLTGGMQEFAYEYPSFCEGAPPSPPRQKQLPKSKNTRCAHPLQQWRLTTSNLVCRTDADHGGRDVSRDRPRVSQHIIRRARCLARRKTHRAKAGTTQRKFRKQWKRNESHIRQQSPFPKFPVSGSVGARHGAVQPTDLRSRPQPLGQFWTF
jgi:centrosomal protein CEP41